MYNPHRSSIHPSLGPAEWVGCGVSDTLRVAASGRIHSVFARACNLQLDHTTLGPSLALLHPELPRTPWGLRLTEGAKGATDEPDMHIRMDDVFSPGELFKILPESQEFLFPASGLTLSFTNARVWDASIPMHSEANALPSTKSLAVLTSLLAEHTPAEFRNTENTQRNPPLADINTLVARRLADGEKRIGAALRSKDGRMLAETALDLMGLGPGLTPAGDDLLMGVLAVLWLQAPENPAVVPLLDSLCQIIRTSSSDRTTPVAAVFMRHACAGLFAENILDVLGALLLPHPGPELRRAGHRLLAFGASSGADTLRGLVCACSALQHGE